jgi:hypothetical protein
LVISPFPLLVGAVKLTSADLTPAATDMPDGSLGGDDKVVVLNIADAQLEPTLFTARNFIGYIVELESPLIVNGLVVTAGEGVTQVLPLSMEY